MPSENETLEKQKQELLKLIRISTLTAKPLNNDFNFALSHWRSDKTNAQFWARTSIRCMCATIEATLFTYRKMAEKLGFLSRVEFDPKELEILTERRIDKHSGVTRPKFLSFKDTVRESFRLLGKSMGAQVNVSYDKGFDALCAAFEVRNRLMHPKSPMDIGINNSDIQTADEGIRWFNVTQVDVIQQCQSQLAARIRAGRGNA